MAAVKFKEYSLWCIYYDSFDLICFVSFYFEKIDNVIKNDDEENASVKDVLMDLWSDNIICKIRRKINNRNVGILDSSIKLNESDCNVVKKN